MLKNLIIVVLLLIIFTDITPKEALDYVQIGLDNLQEVVYNVSEKVQE